jgi:hypothetical protein
LSKSIEPGAENAAADQFPTVKVLSLVTAPLSFPAAGGALGVSGGGALGAGGGGALGVSGGGALGVSGGGALGARGGALGVGDGALGARGGGALGVRGGGVLGVRGCPETPPAPPSTQKHIAKATIARMDGSSRTPVSINAVMRETDAEGKGDYSICSVWTRRRRTLARSAPTPKIRIDLHPRATTGGGDRLPIDACRVEFSRLAADGHLQPFLT